jgi:hypothetical protein
VVNDPKTRFANGVRNEFYLISEGAFDCLALLFCFLEVEVFLAPYQTKARALNRPVKALLSKVHLVTHPLGRSIYRLMSKFGEG